MILGANSFDFDAVKASVPGVTGRRIYRDEINYIPQAWPCPEDHVTLSFRPEPTELLAGHLDAKIKHLISTVTSAEKAQLTCWHEAGSIVGRAVPSAPTGIWYPSYITADIMRRVHDYMMKLCEGTHVSYGINIDGSAVHLRPWLTAVGWYGADIYDGPSFRYNHDMTKPIEPARVASQLGELLTVAKELTGKKAPQVNVLETNARDSRMRPVWFAVIGAWLANNGGRRLLTHWASDGPMSGPWLPGDSATISALRSILATHGAG